LYREGDAWVCPEEGYVEVVRLQRDSSGNPCLVEIKAEFLKDYLCARDMVLRITSYRDRVGVFEDASNVDWPNGSVAELETDLKWTGHVNEIHEGGMPFGGSTAVFHVARTDVDPEEDVPIMELPTDESVESNSWTYSHTGRKLFLVQGRLWRNFWIDKGEVSPRIRNDSSPATVFFITDASGTREGRDTLDRHGRWLWFLPEVMMALAHRRGGSLEWYTRETGKVGCAPDSTVHFGVNKLGLVNVYAKDIGSLADWEQAIWAAYNIGPDGGLSQELQASQVKAAPASTQAPEAFFGRSLLELDEAFKSKHGSHLIRKHEDQVKILKKIHRFRGVDEAGLFALAKDIARLTADSIEIAELHALAAPSKGEKWGSLKSLEKALATFIDPAKARSLLSPLVATYELRLADAHLPSSAIEEAFALLKIDRTLPHVHQARQMLQACVSSLVQIRKVFDSASKTS
jgi:hypothetical protein